MALSRPLYIDCTVHLIYVKILEWNVKTNPRVVFTFSLFQQHHAQKAIVHDFFDDYIPIDMMILCMKYGWS
jgi:hypothetical protein